LANLSAYLTLQRAEEVYGFVPDQYGLTEAQAADIAGVFSQFDVNEDGQLEQSELRQLWWVAGHSNVAGKLRTDSVCLQYSLFTTRAGALVVSQQPNRGGSLWPMLSVLGYECAHRVPSADILHSL